MNGHLVSVEVGIEGRTDKRMQLNSAALNQHCLEGLNAQTVQRRSTVQQDRMILDNLFQHIPDFWLDALDNRLALLILCAKFCSTSLRMTNGLKSSRAIFLGRPHWCSFNSGPTTMTERPE